MGLKKTLFLVLAFSVIVSGCGHDDGTNGSGVGVGGGGSLPPPQSNPYFTEFMNEYALPPEEMPRIGEGALTTGAGKAVTRDNRVVYVDRIFPNGQAEVTYGNDRWVEPDLTPRKNGAMGLYENFSALAPDGRVAYVEKVFADGRAKVSVENVVYVMAGLVPQKLGRYRNYPVLTQDGRVGRIDLVFVDGRATVSVDRIVRVESNVVPRKDGVNGLFAGRMAIARNGRSVLIDTVFADGRAEVIELGSPNSWIESGLTPITR